MNETFTDVDRLVIENSGIVQLSKDSETSGFDLRAGTTWIYPTNYPVRDYQYNITQAALHQNTLVSLPTGLGKTFIAAVVMYNFYRWYPMGKIIFMAPTKPLVHQQMEACYNIMAIPKSASAEMTGTKVNTSRVKIWQEKRVFFITPHILQNDIDSVLELAPQIRCIVIDEAHKALGKNANCEAIKKIQKINPNFRVLALSATPGSNFNSVKDVITNLLISHIEVRTNESIDVAPYVFQRKLDKYVIPITGKLLSVKNQYIKILDKYTRPLLQHNIFTGNCANLTKGRIVLTMKEFKERGRHHNQYGFILKTLNVCVTIYHGYELLIRHGLRAFLQFFKENISKPLINTIAELHAIMDEIDSYLGPLDNVDMLPDGTIPEITGNLVFSHPKFEKLTTILKTHFNQIQDADTRVMVFCEYRESVMEIYTLLLRHRPLIKPRIFLGQGAISQAQQLQAVKMFKSGQCNTLVSTCIGEEGLDVGEVDLIVCFDISSKSPIRMVQRMGRTGRKRDGRVVILVTEGKEEQLLSECLVQRNNMNILLESQQIKLHLYKNNPKMIPNGTNPQCNKMYITVSEPEKPTKKKQDKKVDKKNTKNKTNTNTNALKTMFENISSSQTSTKSSNDSRNTTIASIASKSKKTSTPAKKQADLRSMFSKINHSQINTISNEVIIIDEEEIIEEETNEQFNDLLLNIKSYLNTSFISTNCEICNNLFDCETIINHNNNNNNFINKSIKWDDFNSFDKITADSLKKFTQSLQQNKPKNKIKNNKIEKSFSDDLEKTFEFFKIDSTYDLFSDNSSEHENSFIVNPAIFNQSTGIFNSSRIYETQNNFAPSPTDLFNSSDDELIENVENIENIVNVKNVENTTNIVNNTTPDKILDDIIIEDSSPEKEKSPVFNKSRPRKFGTQRRLFSQSQNSSKNSNISKDFKQLETTNESIKSQQSNQKDISFNTSSISNKTPTKFTFLSKESTNKMHEKVIENRINSTFVTESEKNTTISEPEKNITSNLVHDTNFWDESLFEMCDSDEAIETNENNQNKSNVEEQKNVSNEEDSDTTIILSFNSDTIFENIENIEEEKSIVKEPENMDLNKTVNDQSLLSVTQMLDLLNKTPHNDTIKTQNLLNISKVFESKPIPEKNNDDVIIIDDDVLKEFGSNSDEEQSLLCFSQNIKRKIEPTTSQQQQQQQPQPQPQPTILKEKNEFVAPPSLSQLNLRNRNKKMKLSTKQNLPKNDHSDVGVSMTQDSPLKITKKQLLSKKAIILSDSDDDFEVRPPKRNQSAVFKVTPEKKFKRIKSVTEIGSVLSTKSNARKTKSQCSSTTTSNINTNTNTKIKTKTNKKTSAAFGFLDLEADVSIDEHYESDSEEENESMLESSFIHDTQSDSVLDQTDMQAKYLQSVRSPKKYNPFKMPPLPADISIFSQVENSEDNTYMIDSFCVDSDTTLTQRHGLSYLEMVEAQLEKRVRKEKKRKRLRNTTDDSD